VEKKKVYPADLIDEQWALIELILHRSRIQGAASDEMPLSVPSSPGWYSYASPSALNNIEMHSCQHGHNFRSSAGCEQLIMCTVHLMSGLFPKNEVVTIVPSVPKSFPYAFLMQIGIEFFDGSQFMSTDKLAVIVQLVQIRKDIEN